MTGFQKNLSHLTWDEVFARQRQRDALLPVWMEALSLNAGDHALDLGAGPGFVSLRLAARVGPTGLVYAVDRAPDAIAYLQALMDREHITNIRCVAADVLQFSLEEEQASRISAALLTMMLHHDDEPEALIGHLARLLPTHARAVVAEFHPDGPATSGPPREARIAPEQLQAWLQEAGLRTLDYARQSEEHYMLVVRH